MSAQLELANSLGQRSREELDELLRFRGVPHPERIRDALDLAEVLLKTDSILDALQRTSRPCIDFLAGVVEGCPDEAWRHGLAVVDDSSNQPAAARRLTEVSAVLSSLASEIASSAPEQDVTTVARQSGAEQCFMSIRLSAHLLRVMSETPAPLRQRGNHLSAPALRRLSDALGQDASDLDARLSALFDAGFVMRKDARGVPTAEGLAWLHQSHAEQLIMLISNWFAKQPEQFRASVHEAAASGSHVTFALVRQLFPLTPENLRSSFETWTHTASLLGVLHDHTLTSLGVQILSGAPVEQVAAELPAAIGQVYVQPDLTVIAPGPLSTHREHELLRFATLEQTGIASTYRITPQSLQRALSSGLSEGEIRELLMELSLTGIPQPLDYLLRDCASKQGSLIVRPTEHELSLAARGSATVRTEIVCASEQLALQLSVDRSLVALRLEVLTAHTLGTALTSSHAAELLRSAGYPVTVATSDAAATSSHQSAPTEDPVARERTLLIERIVSQAAGDDSDTAHERLLELAVRKKQRVRVVLHQANAEDRAFVLRPVGLRNGRLRGIDEASQVERTLPIADLVTVEPMLGAAE